MRKKLNKICNIVKRLFFSNSCTLCNKHNNRAGILCFTCLKKIKYFNYKNKCSRCLDIIHSPSKVCSKCKTSNFVFKNAFTCLDYNKDSSLLIKKFKYKDGLFLRSFFIALLTKTINKQMQNIKIDIVCPVPLHYFRLVLRRYNQSSLLAKDMASFLNTKYIYNLVLKNRVTVNQSSLTKKARLKNLENVFIFNKKFTNIVSNKNILLVDDVITTGTTINEVAKELIKGGAKNVYVISIAKSLNV